MNNKTLMMIIGAVVVVLLAVMLVWGVSSCDRETGEEGGLINIGGSEASEESFESESIFEPIYDGAGGVEDWGDEDEESSASSSTANGNNGGNGSSQSSSSENEGEESSSESSSSQVTTVVPSTGNGSSSSSSSSSASSSGSNADEDDGTVTYEEYIAMSGEEQQNFYNTFAKPEDFFAWYNAAKAEYDANQNYIEVDGEIDIGDYIGGGNP